MSDLHIDMSESSRLRIAIAGAGIAGLTAAIALQKHPGIEVQIYERASKLKEIGASIALGPNGMKTLDRLGIENALSDEIAFKNLRTRQPHIYRHWKTNEVVSADKPQTHLVDRHLTARFYRVHLHQALKAHIHSNNLHLSKAFSSVDVERSTGELTIRFVDGTATTTDILLGADGIHSPVRRYFSPSTATKWTGWVTFRSVFPMSHVSHISDLPEEAAHFWGPDRTLFLSRLGKGLYTVVGSYQTDPDAADARYKDAVWNQEGDVNVLREYYKDWSPMVRAVIDAVPYTRIYPNVAAHGLDSWVLGGGRVTLVGDAAHAHGGAFAAGGSLALDDAWAFAASLFHVFPVDAERVPTAGELSRALHMYDQTRRPHTDRVLQAVHSGNKAKVRRVGKLESDGELRVRLEKREDVTWLHEHDVVAAFKAVVENVSGVSQMEAKL